MPDVENTGIRCPHDFHVASDVLTVQHHVFSPPANDFLVKSAHSQKVRPEEERPTMFNPLQHITISTRIYLSAAFNMKQSVDFQQYINRLFGAKPFVFQFAIQKFKDQDI